MSLYINVYPVQSSVFILCQTVFAKDVPVGARDDGGAGLDLPATVRAFHSHPPTSSCSSIYIHSSSLAPSFLHLPTPFTSRIWWMVSILDCFVLDITRNFPHFRLRLHWHTVQISATPMIWTLWQIDPGLGCHLRVGEVH